MTQRHGKPGDPPSPNQTIVLNMLRQAYESWIHRGGDAAKLLGIGIDSMTTRLENAQLGGTRPPGKYGAWQPWHRSTVRDHLNDLVLKGHAKKRIIDRTAYYRPADR